MIPAYPLQWPIGWPRAPSRKSAAFRGGDRNAGLSIAEGRKRVLEELARLRVTHDDVVISTNLRLNLQGLPRGGQGEPGDPGVAVYWERKGKRRVMAIDRYDRVGDNLGAVAATLDAMRAIERHGGAQILDRAFTGFVALPAPGDDCKWREEFTGLGEADVERRYRELANEHHPDKGGDDATMAAINRARDDALQQLRERT